MITISYGNIWLVFGFGLAMGWLGGGIFAVLSSPRRHR